MNCPICDKPATFKTYGETLPPQANDVCIMGAFHHVVDSNGKDWLLFVVPEANMITPQKKRKAKPEPKTTPCTDCGRNIGGDTSSGGGICFECWLEPRAKQGQLL